MNSLRPPGLQVKNHAAILNAVSMFSKAKHTSYQPHTLYHQIPPPNNKQPQNIEMIPLVSQDEAQMDGGRTPEKQCCCCCSRLLLLILFRAILPICVLTFVIATNSANNYAVHVWHTGDLQRHCDEARGLTAGTGTPSSLPAWLGANGGWHPLEWIIICTMFYVVFMAAIILLSFRTHHAEYHTEESMCLYPRSSNRILLITAIVLFLSTALLVATIQMVILLVDGAWDVPECASAVKTPWLRVGQTCFPFVPIMLLVLLLLEIWAFTYTVHA